MKTPFDNLLPTPSAMWNPPKLTVDMLRKHQQKSLAIVKATERIDADHPDYPDASLALMLQAKEGGWLHKEGLCDYLGKLIAPEVNQALSLDDDTSNEEDDAQYRDEVALIAYRSLLAGAACSSEPDKLSIMELIAEATEGNIINVTSFRTGLLNCKQELHRPFSLFDLPVTEHAYRLYHELFEIKEQLIRKVITQGKLEPFKHILAIFKASGNGNQVKNMVGEVSLSDSRSIREYLYEIGESSLDEDIYGRLLGAVSMIEDEFPFVVQEDDIPPGFFEQYGDHLWYEIVESVSKSNFTMRHISDEQKQRSIAALIDTMVLMFKHHDFYPSVMAKTHGRNLASLTRYSKEQPDQQTALAAMIDSLSSQCYSVYADGRVVSEVGVAGKLKPFLVIKAMHLAFPTRDIEKALKTDNERILFYRASGKPLYLKHLQNKSFGDMLMGQDLGL